MSEIRDAEQDSLTRINSERVHSNTLAYSLAVLIYAACSFYATFLIFESVELAAETPSTFGGLSGFSLVSFLVTFPASFFFALLGILGLVLSASRLARVMSVVALVLIGVELVITFIMLS